jgi:hypothetical protein
MLAGWSVKANIFFKIQATISFSRRTLFQEVVDLLDEKSVP